MKWTANAFALSSVPTFSRAEKTKYKAKLFAGCTGDAVLSRLAGAEVMYGREAQSVFGESLAPKEHQKLVMGHSIRWYTEKTDVPSDFPDIDWGFAFDEQHLFERL